MSETKPLNRSESIGQLAMALAKAQSSMTGAVKDSANPFFKSKYADLSSCWDSWRTAGPPNGLAIIQNPAFINSGVEIETILVHESGEWISNYLWLPIAKDDAQGIGSAITYGRRYGFCAITGIAPEDDDGNAASARKHKSDDKPAKEHDSRDRKDQADSLCAVLDMANTDKAIDTLLTQATAKTFLAIKDEHYDRVKAHAVQRRAVIAEKYQKLCDQLDAWCSENDDPVGVKAAMVAERIGLSPDLGSLTAMEIEKLLSELAKEMEPTPA